MKKESRTKFNVSGVIYIDAKSRYDAPNRTIPLKGNECIFAVC